MDDHEAVGWREADAAEAVTDWVTVEEALSVSVGDADVESENEASSVAEVVRVNESVIVGSSESD